MKIDLPLFIIIPKKTKADRKLLLNLNNYPRWHYRTYNQAKVIFTEGLIDRLRGIKIQTPITLEYKIFYGSRGRKDRANFIAVLAKFFCDALVSYKCIPDDTDEFIIWSKEETGGIDKENPRCEVTITSL